jgi:hypothetical protein
MQHGTAFTNLLHLEAMNSATTLVTSHNTEGTEFTNLLHLEMLACRVHTFSIPTQFMVATVRASGHPS